MSKSKFEESMENPLGDVDYHFNDLGRGGRGTPADKGHDRQFIDIAFQSLAQELIEICRGDKEREKSVQRMLEDLNRYTESQDIEQALKQNKRFKPLLGVIKAHNDRIAKGQAGVRININSPSTARLFQYLSETFSSYLEP